MVTSDTSDISSDLILVERAGDGDIVAFDELMRRHSERLYRTAIAILRDEAEAEEAVQDAWWSAWQHFKDFRGEAEPLTWLTRIAVNESLMRLRRLKARAAVIQPVITIDKDDSRTLEEEVLTAPESSHPDNQMASMQLREMLDDQIDSLPEKYRTIFMLRGVEGRAFAEISGMLEMPEPTVRVRFLRARPPAEVAAEESPLFCPGIQSGEQLSVRISPRSGAGGRLCCGERKWKRHAASSGRRASGRPICADRRLTIYVRP